MVMAPPYINPNAALVTHKVAVCSESPRILIKGRKILTECSVHPRDSEKSSIIMTAMIMPRILRSKAIRFIAQSFTTVSSGLATVSGAGTATLWLVSPKNRETMSTVRMAAAIRIKVILMTLMPDLC